MKKLALLILVVMVGSLILTACAGETEKVVETVVVKETVVQKETVVEKETVVQKETVVEKETVVVEAKPGEAERRNTVIFDIDGGRVVDPQLWNPIVPGNRRDHGFHQAMIEPLFMLNYETGIIEPWLGTEMTSNDTFDVWTLKLREGIEWSDGEPMNADDVVFTINMLKDNAPDLSDSAAIDTWVESVEKIDDLTIQFNLTAPNPRFQLDYFSVRIWGSVSIHPEHIWSQQDPLTFTNYDPDKGWPVYTGPYLLDSVSQTEFSYVRNDDWWGAKTGWMDLPKPEKLIWVWYGPEETRTAAMANDGLDSLMDITLGAFLALQQRNPNVIAHFKEMPIAWVPDPCSRTFEFNHLVKPWDDPEMRWAINYLIDRDQIVEFAYEGTTFKSRSFYPAYPPLDRFVDLAIDAGVYDLDQLWTHDPAKAKEIIESKGWVMNEDTGYYEKDGEELFMDITTHEAFIEKQRIAANLVEMFQAAGINATTRNEAGGTWGDNLAFGVSNTRMAWTPCASVNEPWATLDLFNTKWLMPEGERATANLWRWSGPAADEFSALVDEMGTLPLGDPRVDELFIEAMDIWFDELPLIPVTQAKKIIPFSTTYWTNWPTADNPYIHPPTWWQHTHYIIHALEPAQ